MQSPSFASVLITPDLVDHANAGAVLSDRVTTALGPEPVDLLIWFASGTYAQASEALGADIAARLAPRVQLGATAHAVLHDERELERGSAISVLAARLPGATFAPFHLHAQHLSEWATLISDENLFREALGAPADPRMFLLLADPATAPLDLGGELGISIMRALNDFYPGVPAIGGVASNGVEPNSNRLLLNNTAVRSGVIGVAIGGDIDVEIVTSQGCRPIGGIYTVTAAHENMVAGLDGERPIQVVQAMVDGLSPEDRRLLQIGGLYVGRAVRAPQLSDETPGRGDFLIRGVLGVDSRTGALIIGDITEPGDQLQFHVRDGDTALEDLELCLAPQAFSDTPAGALVFTCNGRGQAMFGRPHTDAMTIQSLLAADAPIPLAGFFCAGEIAPIGGRNFLHTHTASIALFRVP
jgi:small ligand-binding sensory domain FIST